MAELNFDHSKELDFLEALGISEEDFKVLNKKFAEMSSHLIMNQPKKSELVQKIAETFSYNELLFACTLSIVDKTVKIVEDNPQVIALMLMKEMFNKKGG